jgi:hypothetical protein
MEEIVKHINDTNASFRTIGAGDAKNTDLFLDNEHYELFRDAGEQITVRFNKENLQKAILFISSILPRKYDNSAIHKTEPFSSNFVFDQLAFLDAFFTVDGVRVDSRTQVWNSRKDIMKKNGEIDNRFYFNGLLEEVAYINYKGEQKVAKFTIRNYLAGGYSDLHIKKAKNGIFDVWVTNTSEYKDDGKEKLYEEIDTASSDSLQQIFYGAPGTGKSNTIKCEVDQKDLPRVRTTFHPDSDYSTFVGAYKPTSVEVPEMTKIGTKAVPVENPDGTPRIEKKIVYEFVPQAFLKAYTGAWKNQDEPFFLIIEEINRGNCAQIFGDLFQLLDRNDETGLSDYPISPDEDIQKFLLTDKKYGFAALTDAQKAAIPIEVQSGELMILPKNLHIWATMNTSDQSLFPIDSAFKRRWEWQYMPISDGKKGWKIAANGKRYDWWQFLQKMNDKIGSATNSEGKKLGYFFCKAKNGIIDAETFVGKVVFYIWNDVFKDFAEEAGDLFKDDDENSPLLSFNKFYTVGIDGKTRVVEEKVELLLQNLGVEPIDDVVYVEENDLDDNPTDEARSSNNRLHVTFPDGETIRIQTSKEYVDVLRKIGLDKAYDVAQSKDPSILKCAFVTKEKEEAIENSTYLRYDTIGEYHVVRGMSGDTMRPFLEKISNQYSLGLKFYRQ